MRFSWAMSEQNKFVKFYTKDARDAYLAENPERRPVTALEQVAESRRQRARNRQDVKVYGI